MKRFILLFLGIVLINGCASHSEKTKNENGGSSNVNKTKSDSATSNFSDEKSKDGEGTENNEKKYFNLATAIVSKDDTAVEKASSQLLSVNASDVKTLNALAMYHAQKGRYALAEMILSKVLKVNDNSYVAYANLGWISFQKGRKRDGINYYKKALESNPDYFVAAANLGSYFAEVKDYGRAHVVLSGAYKKGTKDINLINNYAISQMAVGENADAVFDQGMQINASSINFLVNYCIYLVNVKKDLVKVKEILNKINFVGVNSDRRDVIRNLEEKINSNNTNKESLKR